MYLKWDSIYSVNVKEIDEQHKKVFLIINEIRELKDNYSKEKIGVLLQELKDYGVYHFETEESYFEKFNFPDKDFHIQQHSAYRKKIEEFEELLENNDGEAVEEVTIFLRDWWLNHIQKIDHGYSDLFNQNGVF